MAPPIHRYRAVVRWEGSTGVGYDGYDRRHRVEVAGADGWPDLSADPAFGGEATLVNPEQLLLVSAASCQLLSYLAVAARARVDVVAYEDRAEAAMPEDDRPVRVTEIILRPTITVRGDVGDDRLARYAAVAHRECFIANSLTTSITVAPTFAHLAS